MMRPLRPPQPIRPKVSTMPRPQTEAATYLELYKLVTEQQRLEQELVTLEQRRDRIQTRLSELYTQISTISPTGPLQPGATPTTPQPRATAPTPTDSFNTVFLEY